MLLEIILFQIINRMSLDRQNFIDKRQELVNTMVQIDIDYRIKRLPLEELNEKYKKFKESCPKSWETLISNDLDMRQFVKYSEKYKSNYIESPGNHEEKKFNADADFSKKMADEFLYPKLGSKPSENQYRKTFKKAKKALNAKSSK